MTLYDVENLVRENARLRAELATCNGAEDVRLADPSAAYRRVLGSLAALTREELNDLRLYAVRQEFNRREAELREQSQAEFVSGIVPATEAATAKGGE